MGDRLCCPDEIPALLLLYLDHSPSLPRAHFLCTRTRSLSLSSSSRPPSPVVVVVVVVAVVVVVGVVVVVVDAAAVVGELMLRCC